MASSTTKSPEPTLDSSLASLPADFRRRLLDSYKALKSAYLEAQYDSCGLRAGRFAEVLLRLLQQHLTGAYTPFGTKISNFEAECRKLEQAPTTSGPEGLRVLMPRALAFVYTLRNKRGVGHAGGDVDANEIDAATAARVCDWCMAELIRVFHALSLEEAQALLDAIAERQLPDVWAVAGKKRVLDTSLDLRTRALVLLYSEAEAVPVEDLREWLDRDHAANFMRDVVSPLHRDRLIDYDRASRTLTISPKGQKQVEDVRFRGKK